MGNCLKISNADDISLLRGSDSISVQDTSSEPPGPLPIYSEIIQPMFYPSPSVSRPALHLTEEEQVKIAKRIGLIQHLPIGSYDNDSKKSSRECVICMLEFSIDDPVRYLPCMHIYHVSCIDDWLMRSLTCPSCMEPVDAALLTTYYDTT